jgi:hypothetical protein
VADAHVLHGVVLTFQRCYCLLPYCRALVNVGRRIGDDDAVQSVPIHKYVSESKARRPGVGEDLRQRPGMIHSDGWEDKKIDLAVAFT